MVTLRQLGVGSSGEAACCVVVLAGEGRRSGGGGRSVVEDRVVPSSLMRAVGRLASTLAEHTPWNRSSSLDDGPSWMPDPLTPQPAPSLPRVRRRAGIPIAFFAALLLLAAPVLVLDSAIGSSFSLFAASITGVPQTFQAASSFDPPTPTNTADGSSALGALNIKNLTRSTPSPSGTSTSIPTAIPSATSTPSPSATSTPSPSATPTSSPTSTPTPTPDPSVSPSGSG